MNEIDFIFHLNRLAVYLLPTAMSSLTGNHTMGLLYLQKENFKNLLFNLLITGTSFENLSYLSSCSLSQRWKFWRIRSNVLRDIESDFAYTKVSGAASQYIGLEAYGTQLEVENKADIFINNFKINACFLNCTAWCSQKSYQLIPPKE